MRHIFKVLQEIENATGKQKQLIFEQHLQTPNGDYLADFFYEFYKDINYNLSAKSWEKIVNYDKKTMDTYNDPGELCAKSSKTFVSIEFAMFYELLCDIEKLSGNELIEYCRNNIIESFHPIDIKWLVRFLNKDLRIGMNIKTVNKALKNCGYKIIKQFKVQLCGKFHDITEYNLGFPIIVGVKYDGFRAVISKKGNKVTITSRQGKEVTFIPELIDYFSKIMIDFTFDGEILADDFNLIQKRIGRKTENIEKIDSLHYRIYDIIEYQGEDFTNLPQKDRHKKLAEISTMPSIFDNKLVKLEETFEIINQAELEAIYKVMMIRKEEGIIIKLLDKPYEFDSRKNWWKVKKGDEKTFKIIDVAKGTGKYKDCIAKIRVSDDTGKIKAWVGSGISLETIVILEELHKDNKLIGKFVDIAYMEITKRQEKGEIKYSLRHGVFKKLREDKDCSDIFELEE